MRDAARAAEMSDPDRNRWFRRRWAETGMHRPVSVTDPISTDTSRPVFGVSVLPTSDYADLLLLGHELLAAWRRERAEAGVRRDV